MNMMADHPNAALLKKGYAAFSTGDLDGVRALFAHDIVWHQPGKNRFSGAHRGVDNVLALFLAQAQESEGTFKVEVHDILANDEHGIALATVSATKGGKTLRDRYAHAAHFKDGKMTESWIFGEHQDEVDAFWS
jgi:uncharacterized protein